MKRVILIFIALVVTAFSCDHQSQTSNDTKCLFLDVHNLEPGKVTFDAVAEAHQKDLATQDKFGVKFIKYWVDEKAGKVYCLAESKDSVSISESHKEAHGLVPDLIHRVTDGPEAPMSSNPSLYLDVHHLGAGKVTAKAVAEAHEKDLAVQDKYGVKFIRKNGRRDVSRRDQRSYAMIKAHAEAHGLIPDEMHSVKQGQ